MFECTLEQGELFRRIITALSDLVNEGNFMIDSSHISFQGMDSSHVSLCALSMNKSGFSDYRCDRNITMGIHFIALQKVLKCMGSRDSLSIKHEEDTGVCDFIFEDQKESCITNFSLKLFDIEADQLGIPDTEYTATVKMPSQVFQRICRDFAAIGDCVTIDVSKEGIVFSVEGEIGKGRICLKGHTSVKKTKKVKDENSNNDEDKDMDMDGEEEEEDDNYGNVDDNVDDQVIIQMSEVIQQKFSLRYLCSFTKATNLSKFVVLMMGDASPLVCEYKMDNGYIKYYLAPKIDDEDE